MKKSKIVFGSNSELQAFQAINRHLPEGWTLLANTPLAIIIDAEKSELPDNQWDFFLKTSVDFVLVNPHYEPILAIEFDGLGNGFSSGTKYVLNQLVEYDPHRELKANFKLRLCDQVGLPLVIISFEEIGSVGGDDLLAIINSMVGICIAMREYRSTIEEWDRQQRGKGKTFEEMLWEDSVLRTELNFKYDPSLIRLDEIAEAFNELGASWSMQSVSKPDQMTVLRKKSEFSAVGSKIIVKGGKLDVPVIVTVWVRNFAGKEMGANLDSELIPSNGINPLKVAENIAWYLSHRRALEVAGVLPS